MMANIMKGASMGLGCTLGLMEGNMRVGGRMVFNMVKVPLF